MQNAKDVQDALTAAFNEHGAQAPEVVQGSDGSVTVSDSQTGFMMRSKNLDNLVKTTVQNLIGHDAPDKIKAGFYADLQASTKAQTKPPVHPISEARRQRWVP